ncbi:anti-sigma factor domain-containing protein [Streptomyces sp. NPDC059866]|uniref:anti-sigma factor n=1 Tax=Streptomyces sp. NPDC059866 TaxID=3346978 RepID=UPI0036489533
MSVSDDPCLGVGAYALHALPPGEEAAFENHLASCTACRREADEVTQAAAWLGALEVRKPSADLRRGVLERIATVRQERAVTSRRHRRQQRGLAWALAASVAAAAALGGVAWWQHSEADTAREQVADVRGGTDALADVLTAADATISTSRMPHGATASVIASRAQSRTAFVASGLPPLTGDRVYELWYGYEGRYRPAGLLSSAGGSQAQVLEGRLGEATAVCVTVEPAGGSPQPTTALLAIIPVPA